MFALGSNLIYFLAVANLIRTSYVCANVDLREIFGKNINSEEGWAKLFELEKCPKPQKWDDTIIMVNESLSAGAKFLDNPNVTSRLECEFQCCYKQDDGCNVAIYSAKQKHCYMFDCGKPSKCKFDQHAGYTVSLITDVINPETTVKALTLTTEAPATTQPPAKQLHLLDGCRLDIDSCVTQNAECSNTGFCMCKDGYHPKNGVCRTDCLQGLQFECTNGDPKYGRPDCIAVYDVCDGTPQCPDGSDEHDCKDTKFDWSKLGNAGEIKAKVEGNAPLPNSQKGFPTPAPRQHGYPTPPASRLPNYPTAAPRQPSLFNGHSSELQYDRNHPGGSRIAGSNSIHTNVQRKNGLIFSTSSPYYVNRPENGYANIHDSYYPDKPKKPATSSYYPAKPKQRFPDNYWRDEIASLYGTNDQRTDYPRWPSKDRFSNQQPRPSSRYNDVVDKYYNSFGYEDGERYRVPSNQQPEGYRPQSKPPAPMSIERADGKTGRPSYPNAGGASKTPPPTTTVKAKTEAVDIQAILGQMEKSKGSGVQPAPDKSESQLSNLQTTTESAPTASVFLKTENIKVNGTLSENEAVLTKDGSSAMSESSRSAVIALSLSLTLTFILIIYLGCRYRNVKSRITRHGKPLSGSEVDYLIDGMYL